MQDFEHTDKDAGVSRHIGMFLAACVGLGALVGILARPDGWFVALQKPALFPGESGLAAIWLIYFAIMAFIGARLWQRGDAIKRGRSYLACWGVQMICTLGWPIVLYKAHNLALTAALAVCAALCGLGVAIWSFRRDTSAFPAAILNTLWLLALASFSVDLAVNNMDWW